MISLRQDKADAESSYTQQLFLVQAEKQEMMESHDRVEQHMLPCLPRSKHHEKN
ncbi:hypothetical protein DAPPUDRAFT_244403 [Daphnia pulex]|uniref:Uncharacterized protein n=1 Tax=Daphnia pulex TaxID=6669 RepID=E9GKV9_DAPPU|nr:hypothetical protein DAPPUDRAFT_244403 [Daphnia pulex]|eukprot:EFX79900.1 hypothetical protein DAPPUDRAFT_244403 [Daphnia pulex]